MAFGPARANDFANPYLGVSKGWRKLGVGKLGGHKTVLQDPLQSSGF